MVCPELVLYESDEGERTNCAVSQLKALVCFFIVRALAAAYRT